jgi:hypothetical protein
MLPHRVSWAGGARYRPHVRQHFASSLVFAVFFALLLAANPASAQDGDSRALPLNWESGGPYGGRITRLALSQRTVARLA